MVLCDPFSMNTVGLSMMRNLQHCLNNESLPRVCISKLTCNFFQMVKTIILSLSLDQQSKSNYVMYTVLHSNFPNYEILQSLYTFH